RPSKLLGQTNAKSSVNRSCRDRAGCCSRSAKLRLARASQRFHRCGPSLVRSTLLVLPAALLLLSSATILSSATTGRSPASAGHRGATAAVVLVLLPERQSLLSDCSNVLRGLDQGRAAVDRPYLRCIQRACPTHPSHLPAVTS